MSMRRVLNVAWTLAVDGMDAEGIKQLHHWVYERPMSEVERMEEDRKQRAVQNQAAVADLASLFSSGA